VEENDSGLAQMRDDLQRLRQTDRDGLLNNSQFLSLIAQIKQLPSSTRRPIEMEGTMRRARIAARKGSNETTRPSASRRQDHTE
jgi:hypothetical protein